MQRLAQGGGPKAPKGQGKAIKGARKRRDKAEGKGEDIGKKKRQIYEGKRAVLVKLEEFRGDHNFGRKTQGEKDRTHSSDVMQISRTRSAKRLDASAVMQHGMLQRRHAV